MKVYTETVGKMYGNWIQIGPEFKWTGSHRGCVCRCSLCNRHYVVRVYRLKKGDSTKCRECNMANLNSRATHSRSGTPEYSVWEQMVARCHNASHQNYRYYGGRGISVCSEWRGAGGFTQFLSDVGERPSRELQLDRVDNNGNYEPGNVRWASRKQNCRNQRSNVILTIDGRSMCVAEWAEQPGAVGRSSIRSRLRAGWTPRDSVFAPVVTKQSTVVGDT